MWTLFVIYDGMKRKPHRGIIWYYLLPSSSLLCLPHKAGKSYRQYVKAKNNDFIWKPGRLRRWQTNVSK